MALIRSDPYRDFDRLFSQLWGSGPSNGSAALAMPLDAYRKGDAFLITLDLPGVSADSVELTVESDVLTIRAERPSPKPNDEIETLISERPYGTFTRQVFLGANLDTDKIEADYKAGVLTVSIPVAGHARPRRIQVNESPESQELMA